MTSKQQTLSDATILISSDSWCAWRSLGRRRGKETKLTRLPRKKWIRWFLLLPFYIILNLKVLLTRLGFFWFKKIQDVIEFRAKWTGNHTCFTMVRRKLSMELWTRLGLRFHPNAVVTSLLFLLIKAGKESQWLQIPIFQFFQGTLILLDGYQGGHTDNKNVWCFYLIKLVDAGERSQICNICPIQFWKVSSLLFIYLHRRENSLTGQIQLLSKKGQCRNEYYLQMVFATGMGDFIAKVRWLQRSFP